jgi:hypothetical protein
MAIPLNPLQGLQIAYELALTWIQELPRATIQKRPRPQFPASSSGRDRRGQGTEYTTPSSEHCIDCELG